MTAQVVPLGHFLTLAHQLWFIQQKVCLPRDGAKTLTLSKGASGSSCGGASHRILETVFPWARGPQGYYNNQCLSGLDAVCEGRCAQGCWYPAQQG